MKINEAKALVDRMRHDIAEADKPLVSIKSVQKEGISPAPAPGMGGFTAVGLGLPQNPGDKEGFYPAVRIYSDEQDVVSQVRAALGNEALDAADFRTGIRPVAQGFNPGGGCCPGKEFNASFAGTAGAIVRSFADDQQRYVLTAGHVAAYAGAIEYDQACVVRDCDLSDSEVIAKVQAWSSPLSGGALDWAVLRLPDGMPLVPRAYPSGKNIQLPPLPVDHYRRVVWKVGLNGHTQGYVSTINLSVPILYRVGGGVRQFWVHDMMEITGEKIPFSLGGDSGSLVVDQLSNRPYGMIIAGDPEKLLTYAHPIQPVLAHAVAQIA
jgi:hypothetical protein